MASAARPARRIRVQDGTLLRDGEPMQIRSGEVHYWRIDRAAWEPVLDSLVALRATAVTVYAPWEAHEVAPGRFDFGESDPQLDLDAFLTLAEARGLDLVARPGPQINGEMPWFGYPRRLLEREDLHMRSAIGSRTVLTQVPKPIPALSYANDDFFAEAEPWLDAVCAVLAKHAHPRGRLVAVQVDNEMAYFFNLNAWAADFSDASIARYRRFVEQKYGDEAALRSVYGDHAAPFARLQPPRRFSATTFRDIPWHADWAEYRERYLVDAIGRLAGMFRERGLDGIGLFHNYPHPLNAASVSSGTTAPFHLAALEEQVDWVGFDVYSTKEQYPHVKTVESYVAGTSRFPYAPELVGGSWPWYLGPGGAVDEDFVIGAALMHGLRGFSRYMMADRERWLGSPVRRDGTLNPGGAAVALAVNALIADHDLAAYRRRADVLLVADRDYERLAAASVLVSFPGDFLQSPTGFSEYPNDVTVSEDALGLGQSVALEKTRRLDATMDALSGTGHSWLFTDTGAGTDRWAEYAAVLLTTYEYVSAAVQRAVVAYAAAGGTAVIGPRVPEMDERMQLDTTLRDALGDAGPGAHDVGTGRVVVLEGTPDAAGLAAALEGVEALVARAGEGLDVAVHQHDGDPDRALVFVANPSGDDRAARVDVGRRVASAVELRDGRDAPVVDGAIAEQRPAWTVAVYDCTFER